MGDETKRYWFPAKRYGWGWGPPATWQGWVVMLVWLAGIILGSNYLAGRGHLVGFGLFTFVMCAALVGVCAVKGEPPRWRWGDE